MILASEESLLAWVGRKPAQVRGDVNSHYLWVVGRATIQEKGVGEVPCRLSSG